MGRPLSRAPARGCVLDFAFESRRNGARDRRYARAMKVLALELSSSHGSIALSDAGTLCFAAEFANDRKHSGLFFTHLERCVAECGNAERIVVGLGPGSYAGTRITIAAAIGLAAASDAQLLGLPSISALTTDEPEYAVIGDARRQSFFFVRVHKQIGRAH